MDSRAGPGFRRETCASEHRGLAGSYVQTQYALEHFRFENAPGVERSETPPRSRSSRNSLAAYSSGGGVKPAGQNIGSGWQIVSITKRSKCLIFYFSAGTCTGCQFNYIARIRMEIGYKARIICSSAAGQRNFDVYPIYNNRIFSITNWQTCQPRIRILTSLAASYSLSLAFCAENAALALRAPLHAA